MSGAENSDSAAVAYRELPIYKSHKLVRAIKIGALEIHKDGSARIAPADFLYAPFDTAPGWGNRFNTNQTEESEDLGYWVLYDDGYESWSPTKAFEEGYSLVQPPHTVREIYSHRVNGLNENISIEVVDEPGPCGANHEYVIGYYVEKCDDPCPTKPFKRNFTKLSFQNGAIKEAGFNGISNEALLAIVEDRLSGFQQGEFACEENAEALTAVRAAMAILKNRTRTRMEQGVEGEHKQHVSN